MEERIKEIRIKWKIDSDHQPLEVTIKGKERWEARNRIGRRCGRGRWDERGCERQ